MSVSIPTAERSEVIVLRWVQAFNARLGDEADIGPVCALHQVDDGLIVTAREYLTAPDMIERLGLIP